MRLQQRGLQNITRTIKANFIKNTSTSGTKRIRPDDDRSTVILDDT